MSRSLSRSWWQRIQVGSLVLIIATLGLFAYRANGYPVTKLDLNDTGIWISNDAAGYYGRLNKAALGLDASPGPPGERHSPFQIDILQDGNMVVGHDVKNAKLTAINAAMGASVPDNAVDVAPGSTIAMHGGTLAVMSPSGKIWAVRYDPAAVSTLDVAGLDGSGKPLGDLGLKEDQPAGTVAMTVGLDGTIYGATIGGQSVRIPTNEAGGFAQPEASGGGPTYKTVQLAAVGGGLVSYDAVGGTVTMPGGKTATLGADPKGRLQDSGPDAGGVLVATSTDFSRIDLSTGAVSRLDGSGDGAPAQPVRLGDCNFGAWAGAARYVRQCGAEPAAVRTFQGGGTLERPAFRINHALITLNDMANGKAFDLDTLANLANWEEIKPKEEADNSEQHQEVSKDQAKPKAVPDDLKARADRVTVLHVLDNDTDTAGGVLMITDVSGVKADVTVAIAPDGQTLLFSYPESVPSTSFRYTISNGSKESTGDVTVTNPGQRNEPPYEKASLKGAAPTYTAAALGNLSIPATGTWRDPEGDPISLLSAKDGDAAVPVTSDGRLDYTAPVLDKTATRRVTYTVTDDLGTKPVEGTINVRVLGQGETKSQPAQAQPDTARGQTGKPVTVWPLANDIPGADPRTPQARLALDSDVARKQGLSVVTDAKAGSVAVTAKKAGSYFLEYYAGFGNASPARAEIRVDIANKVSDSPVAVPDQAAVHGTSPVMVDVLANDYDPAGGLLTVTSSDPADAGAMQAAVIGGRWIRIVPTSTENGAGQQVIHYRVSNGTQTAKGDVLVTRLEPIAEDEPLVRDDFAAVRDGDSVRVAVLSNDTSLSGAPLRLASNIEGNKTVGQLKVINPAVSADDDQGDVGTAYIHNNSIRYVAPAQVKERQQFVIEYVALASTGASAVGNVTVTVNPQPTEDDPDRAPVPATVEMRVNSGSRVSIPVPTSGTDPDGDAVSVVGITSAPKLGRVVSFSPSAVTYEAYPTDGLTGTDTFSYVVMDKYGKTGESTIRVAVSEPGQTQPPVAVDDTVTGSPGSRLKLNVLTNDLINRDDSASIAPLESGGGKVPDGVTLVGKSGPITATAPSGDAQPFSFNYALKGNGGTGPSGTVTVNSKEGYNNPPFARDQTAKVDGTNGTADLLAGAWDAESDSLTVRLLASPEGATLTGSTLTIPLAGLAQVVPFEVADPDGATTAGVVYVPAGGSGAPVLKPGALIKLDQNGTATLPLADYVISPRGREVRFSAADITPTPPEDVAAQTTDATNFKATASNDYVGPAALVVEVMDAASNTDPDVQKATISIPVQVGPDVPVLRCPTDPQVIMQGGEAKDLDITTLCHVWAPASVDLASVTYTATWATQPADVTASANGGKVTLQAGSNAVGGDTGTLTIGVANSPAKTAELKVRVKEAPPPTLQSKTYPDVKQGTSFDVSLSMRSPLLNPQFTIASIKQVSGPPTTEVHDPASTKITFTPAADAHGPAVFEVMASDVSDLTRTNRVVRGTITLIVYGVPGAPGAPQPGNTIQSRSVALRWAAAASNGAAIDKYEITADSGKTWTVSGTSANVTGLVNDVPVTFTVKAHNKAGWGEPSGASRSVRPDAPPGAPTGIKASNPQDHSLTLSWTAPKNDGSPITKITIAWPGGSKEVSGGTTSTVLTGLNNNTKYTFTVWAKNKYPKPGPSGTGTGQSSGKPLGLSVNQPVATAALDSATTPVRVTWPAADPNGPAPVTYALDRSDGKKICSGTQATTCTDDTVTFDGKTYTYTLTGTNATGGTAHTATSAPSPKFQATGKPPAWTTFSATTTGKDGEVLLKYTVPPSRGASSTVTLSGASGSISNRGGTAGGADETRLAGLNNGQSYTLSLKVCNENNACSSSQSVTVMPYGPLAAPRVTYTGMSGTTVKFSVSGSGNGNSATLKVTANKSCSGTGSYDTGTGTGNKNVDVSCDVGYSSNATVTAELTDNNPSRNGGSDSQQSATTPDPPKPTLSVSEGADTFTRSDCTSGCKEIYVTSTGFSGPVHCTIYGDHGGTSAWSSFTLDGTNTRQDTGAYYGFWGSHVWVTCGSISSPKVVWT